MLFFTVHLGLELLSLEDSFPPKYILGVVVTLPGVPLLSLPKMQCIVFQKFIFGKKRVCSNFPKSRKLA
jgi:hypothetical protein